MQFPPTVPGYELIERLGGGPLTCVYSARDSATDELGAVKLLRPDWEDQPTAVKLLQRERARVLPSVILIWCHFSSRMSPGRPIFWSWSCSRASRSGAACDETIDWMCSPLCGSFGSARKL